MGRIAKGWRWAAGAIALVVVMACGAAAAAGVQAPLSTAQLQELIQREGEAVFLLDVRTSGEWARGRIVGSVHIPMDQIPARIKEIPRDKKIVAVCASGARSEAVARYLAQQGFPWVANYRDGVVGWSRSGLALVR